MIVNTLKGQENFIELIDKYIECPVIGSSDLENIADKPLINLRHLTKWLKELELNEMCPLNPALVKQYINQKIIERVNAIFMECNNTFHSVFKRLNAVYKVGYDDRDITYMINKIRIYEALNEAFEPVVIHDSVRNFNELLLREITDILKHEINKCDDPLLFNINIVQNMMIELNNFNNMDPRINDAVKIIAEERNKTYERAFKKLVDILIDELCFCRIKDNRTRRAIGLRKLQLFVNSVHVPRPPKVEKFKEYIEMRLERLRDNQLVFSDFDAISDSDSDESLE